MLTSSKFSGRYSDGVVETSDALSLQNAVAGLSARQTSVLGPSESIPLYVDGGTICCGTLWKAGHRKIDLLLSKLIKSGRRQALNYSGGIEAQRI